MSAQKIALLPPLPGPRAQTGSPGSFQKVKLWEEGVSAGPGGRSHTEEKLMAEGVGQRRPGEPWFGNQNREFLWELCRHPAVHWGRALALSVPLLPSLCEEGGGVGLEFRIAAGSPTDGTSIH